MSDATIVGAVGPPLSFVVDPEEDVDDDVEASGVSVADELSSPPQAPSTPSPKQPHTKPKATSRVLMKSSS
jgi:hypothetical protein